MISAQPYRGRRSSGKGEEQPRDVRAKEVDQVEVDEVAILR